MTRLEKKTKHTIIVVAVIPVLLLMTTAARGAYAWGGCVWGNCGGYGYHHYWSGGNGCDYGCGDNGGGLGLGGGGYQEGIQDAIFDHDNGNAYNPIGQCLPCHSGYYWNNFHEGYDHQWNSYQSQVSNQGSSINIYGNNNYVSTSQLNNQEQNPLQQLAHVACGFVNCNGPSQQGYEP